MTCVRDGRILLYTLFTTGELLGALAKTGRELLKLTDISLTQTNDLVCNLICRVA
jgi:hypothetical protein